MSDHVCYLCDPANPERIFDGNTARFPKRFVGPPQRAHGGMAVASLLCPAQRAAERNGIKHLVPKLVSGRLHAPVQLETDMSARVTDGDGYSVTVEHEGAPMVSGRVEFVTGPKQAGEMIQSPPQHLAEHLAALCAQADADLDGPSLLEQSDQYYADAGLNNENNVCFGCSEKSHALKLHNRLTGCGDIWTRWIVDEDFVEHGERIAVPIIVAALDCSNLWIMMAQETRIGLDRRIEEGRMWITGSHAVHLLRLPPPGTDLRVLARFLGQSGRKGKTMSAMIGRDGTPYAVAEAVNILIDEPPEMRVVAA